ncbi:uncharacterized protein LOC119728243 [Patiria miniata]|uniref:Uncharacterized protein n=1 Tax=Patiria miniata TaxID=46514 RepID=A0A913ZZ39_PATMI|nr:uncharacterized protein LOC119728243 [Patiria miniata]
MLGNILEDYLRHAQQHQHSWAELLFAVPSTVQLCSYTHDGMLDKTAHQLHLLSEEMILYCKTETEDLVSSLLRWCRVDLEKYSLTSLRSRTIEFVHHDGEMFEVIPSSVPESSPMKQDCCSEVKDDITKKRKSLAKPDSARDIGFFDNGLLFHLEIFFLMNIQPEDLLLHYPDISQLCNCLTAKPVQDPFIGTSVLHFDDRPILRQSSAPESEVAVGQADVQISSRCRGYMQEFSIEEALSISETLISHVPREYCAEIDHAYMGGILPQHPLQNFITARKCSEQESTPGVMSTSTPYNIEKFGAIAAEKVAFVDLNTEGLPELHDETAFVLDCAVGRQPYLIHSEPATNYFRLVKWKVQETEQMKLCFDTVCMERKIFKIEENFTDTFTLKLQGTDLRERIIWISSISQAAHCLQYRYRDLSDQTLPWDPVAKLSTIAVNTWHESVEPFFSIDKSDGMLENAPQKKFVLHNSFFDELENCLIQSPSGTSDAGIRSTHTCSYKLHTAKSQQGIQNTEAGSASLSNGTQMPANSLEDFLFLTRGPCMTSARSSKDAMLISKPNLLECNQIGGEQLTSTPTTHNRCYLTCQKVPGETSGQTRLAFLTQK